MLIPCIIMSAAIACGGQTVQPQQEKHAHSQPTAGDFDTVSAWVTGNRFAYGANRDRIASGCPQLVAVFSGITLVFCALAYLGVMGRH